MSPGATPALAKPRRPLPVPFLPGCATVSEAMALRELGFRALKLFPAEAVGGARLLASLSAPLPDLRFCPTGGSISRRRRTISSSAMSLVSAALDAAERRAGEGRLCDRGKLAREAAGLKRVSS